MLCTAKEVFEMFSTLSRFSFFLKGKIVLCLLGVHLGSFLGDNAIRTGQTPLCNNRTLAFFFR